mmetsp:Transcript_103280/g.296484  ORF Transcript_103280/g.296484 Transcript_103280/m.296484 type:complete len:517 (+) Transcript_103280:91-1641(+)
MPAKAKADSKDDKKENVPKNVPQKSEEKDISKDSKDSKEGAAVEAYRAKLKEEREKITLITRPHVALPLFIRYVTNFVVSNLGGFFKKPVVWLVLAPSVALWFALKLSLAPELFAPPVCGGKDGAILWQIEFAMIEASWWIILGILSSVGFGTGLHSGLMFLFPHIMQVVSAAEACRTTVGLVPWYQHPCKLDCSTVSGPRDDSTVTFLRLWALVTVPCMLWGFGTAVGEIPPYSVAKMARMSGSSDSEFEAEVEEAKSKTDLFSKMKIWTISFTEKHGFMGVFVLAAWPNAAFDMCGMCCGYLMMPFWTFFIATACGKGIVKVNGQAVVFVNLFGSWFFQVLASAVDSLNTTITGIVGKDFYLKDLVVKGREKLLNQFQLQSRMVPEKLFAGQIGDLDIKDIRNLYEKYDKTGDVAQRVLKEWDKDGNGEIALNELKDAASRTDGMVSLGALDPGAGQSILKMAWELFVVGLVLFFVVSIVNQLARSQQQELDDAKVEEFSKSKGGDKKEAKKTK